MVTPDTFNVNKSYEEKDMQRYQGAAPRNSRPKEDPSKPRSSPFRPILALALDLAVTRRSGRRCRRRAHCSPPDTKCALNHPESSNG
jgi:hypothetical protein